MPSMAAAFAALALLAPAAFAQLPPPVLSSLLAIGSLPTTLLSPSAHAPAASAQLASFATLDDPAEECAIEIFKWASDKTYQSWGGLKMIDSWGKVPSGVFDLGFNALGSLTECLRANSTAGFQYGVLTSTYPYNNISVPVKWGVCVPSICDAKSTPPALEMVLDTLAALTNQDLPAGVSNTVKTGTMRFIEPTPCFMEINSWFTSPARRSWGGLKMLDSWGKVSPGIFDGGFRSLGSFTECFRANDTAGFRFGVLSATYTYGTAIPIQLGVCVPSICDENSTAPAVELVFEAVAGVANFDLPKNLTSAIKAGTVRFIEPPVWTTGRVTMVSIFAILLFLSVAGTALARLYEFLDRRELSRHADLDGLTSGDEAAPLMANQDGRRARIASPSRTSNWRSVVQSFDLYTNLVKLFAPFSGPHPATAVLDGIRVLSMFWVILGHANLWAFQTGVENYPDLEENLNSFLFQIILNAYYSVDTFFFLSGFLVTYMAILTLEKSPKFNYIVYVVVRYLRLTPTYMLVLFSYWHLQGLFGYGPLWLTKNTNKNCENYWWTNLIYINNIKPGPVYQECMGWTWYLANDTQFYILAPLIFLPMMRKGKARFIGYFFVIAGILTHLISAAVISYDNDLPVTPIPPAKSHGYDGLIYVKPYTRVATYIIGMLCAQVYLLGSSWLGLPGYSPKSKQALPASNGTNAGTVNDAPDSPTAIKAAAKSSRFSGLRIFGLWLLAFVICGSLIFSFADLKIGTALLDPTYFYPWSRSTAAFYNAVSRPLWGIAMFIVTYLLLTNRGGVLTSFLAHAAFSVPARLTYGAYLVHEPVVDVFYGNLNSYFHFNGTLIAYVFLGSTVIAYLVSFGIYMIAEAPLMGLVKLMVGLIRRPSKKN